MTEKHTREPGPRLEERGRNRLIILGLGVALAAGILASFALGRYPIPVGELIPILTGRLVKGLNALINAVAGLFGASPGEVFSFPQTWTDRMEIVFFNIRLPRLLLACLVGCCLSAAGAAYQGVFQNPMASPDLLGATKGAAFGAALAILLRLGSRMVMVSAFVFGLLTVAAAVFVSSRAKGKRVLSLVLSGIMISSLFEAGTSFIKLVADPNDQLPSITYWLMGSLSASKMSDVTFALIPMIAGLAVLLLLRWHINILTLGDDEARTMGVNARRTRFIVILAATLITASSVAVSGSITWVGLVVPHLVRRLLGNNYRYLMPATMIFGALFLLMVDNISRNLLAVEIPLGILTAFVGAPFFLYLITRGGERA